MCCNIYEQIIVAFWLLAAMVIFELETHNPFAEQTSLVCGTDIVNVLYVHAH